MNRAEALQELPNFGYEYLHGPVSEHILNATITKGNCRLAVQCYFNKVYGMYLGPDDIVLPEAKDKGFLMENKDTNIFLNGLREGDIIYAEKIRNSHGKEIKTNNKKFETEEERLRNLHLGVYLGVLERESSSRFSLKNIDDIGKPVIWHSSFISKGTDLWSVEKFCNYYLPIIARRVI